MHNMCVCVCVWISPVSPNAVVTRALGPTCEIKFMCGQPPSLKAVTAYIKLMSMTHIGDITATAL